MRGERRAGGGEMKEREVEERDRGDRQAVEWGIGGL